MPGVACLPLRLAEQLHEETVSRDAWGPIGRPNVAFSWASGDGRTSSMEAGILVSGLSRREA